MTTRPRPVLAGLAVLAMLAAGALALGGCTSDAKPNTTSAVSTSSVAPSTSSAASSSSPSPSASGLPADYPDAAKANTDKGAEAFVRYFVEVMNRAWTSADPSLLTGYGTPECSSCKNYIKRAQDLKAQQRHFASDPLTIKSVTPLGPNSRKNRVLQVVLTATGAKVVNASGTVLDQDGTGDVPSLFELQWKEGRWHVYGVE